MQEFIGLAYFAEIPVTIMNVQRGGPSTGMPTRTQQSDLTACAYASHGDTKHVMLLPQDPHECFEHSAAALDLASLLGPVGATLDGLIGVSSSAKADVSKTREDRMKAAGAELKELTAEHPIVRTHPETGRKALYTSDAHTSHIKGWTEKESLPLLRFLWEHQTRPEFTCRFRWEAGSLAFWDNRAAMHNPINDYHGYRRVMHRITLAGDKPR